MNWQEFVSVIAVPAFGAIFVLIGWLEAKKATEFTEVWKAVNSLREGLKDFQLESSRTYTSNAAVEKMETRLLDRLDRIEKKIDRHEDETWKQRPKREE